MNGEKNNNARRIPMRCWVEIEVVHTGEVFYGVTVGLSVEGVSFLTRYVPRFAELLEIRLIPPEGSVVNPLRALIQVESCTQIIKGREYEIDSAIREIRE